MGNLVRIILLASFVSVAFSSVGLAQETLACPDQFSVEERDMILEEAAPVINNKVQPSICFQKLIDQTMMRRQSAGVTNIELKDIVGQLATSAWKAEVSEK